MKSKQSEMVEVEGRMIPRHKVGFFLGTGKLEDGREVLCGRHTGIYEKDPATGQLRRLDKVRKDRKGRR